MNLSKDIERSLFKESIFLHSAEIHTPLLSSKRRQTTGKQTKLKMEMKEFKCDVPEKYKRILQALAL